MTTESQLLLLDPLGGLAGDMFVAAVLDAFPNLEGPLNAALERAEVGRHVQTRRVDHNDGVFAGARFETAPAKAFASSAPEKPSAEHAHYHYSDLRETLGGLDLPRPVVERALDIMRRLATAEGTVHGVAAEDAVLHEVGAWDSLADIVCAAWLVEALAGSRWFCRALPLGSGRVRSAHGLLPVPAPATAELLRGMPMHDDGIPGERVTPTGAAILAHIGPSFDRLPPLSISHAGTGFGTRKLDGASNALRVLVADAEGAAEALRVDMLVELRFEVDDQSAEDLAAALDWLRGRDGVLELTQAAVFGKKGRLTTQVQLLCTPAAREGVVTDCLVETTTLGVRWQAVQRTSVARELVAGATAGGEVRVKHSVLPDGAVRSKAELDDLADTRGREAREARRREAEESAAQDPPASHRDL